MATEKNDTDSRVPAVIFPPIYGKIVLSLDNCLLPPEKLERSPSVIDGLDPEMEYDLRIMGCELIQTAGILLKLPQVAMATGQVLFQRFYFSKSFVRHPMDIKAMGCIYLASKIEEAPRRIRDVINVFHHIRQVRCQKPIIPLILDQQYINLKFQVIKAERRILKELGFCVHVKHPHKLIVCYLQVLMLEKNRAALQMAWNFINDSLRTNVFLQYSPETVACACIYLTARKLRIVLPKNPPWFSLFNVKEEDILEVCRKIIKLYQRPKIDPEILESKVEALKKSYEDEREKHRSNNIAASENNTPNSNASQHKTPTPPLKTRKTGTDLSPKRSPVKSPRKISEPSPRRKVPDRDRNSRNSNDSHDSSPRTRKIRDRDSSPRTRKNRDHDSSPRTRKTRDHDSNSRSRKIRDRNSRHSNDSHDSSPRTRKIRERDRNSRHSNDSLDSSPRKNRDRERDRERERERDRDRDRDSRSKKDREYRSSRRDRRIFCV